MIRYSSYASANYRVPRAQTPPDPLEAEYRQLKELRERVRKAEAAAARPASNGKRTRHVIGKPSAA